MAIIYDPDFVRKVGLLLQSRGGQSLNEVLPGTIMPVIDLTPLLANFASLSEPGGLPPGSNLDLTTGEYFGHANRRNSPAGGAGQFSGVGDTFESRATDEVLTRLELIYLRVVCDVAYHVRIYYETQDVFGLGTQNARNLLDNSQPVRSRITEWGAQTALPDTTNIPNHSARSTLITFPSEANAVFEWGLAGRLPFLSRGLVGDQSRALGWGAWARATVTAITADYTIIYRQIPSP